MLYHRHCPYTEYRVPVEHRALQELTANDRLDFLMKQTEIYAHFVKDKKTEDKKAKSVL